MKSRAVARKVTFIHQPDDFIPANVRKLEESLLSVYQPVAKRFGLHFEFLPSRNVIPAVSHKPELWCGDINLLDERRCYLLEQTSVNSAADRFLRGIYEVITTSDSILLNRTTEVRDFIERDKLAIANSAARMGIRHIPSIVVPFGKYAIRAIDRLSDLQANEWILKPREMAMGRGVMHFSDLDQLKSALDLVAQSAHSYIIQPFLKAQGDLRVYTIDGHVVTAQLREPQSGRIIANTSRGGSSSIGQIDDWLKSKCEMICKELGARYLCIDWLMTDDGPVLNEWCTTLGGFKSLPEPARTQMTEAFFAFIDREIKTAEGLA